MWSAAIFSGSWKGLQKKNALPTFAKYYMLSTYLYLVNSAKMFAKHGWPTETEDTVNQNQTTDFKSPFRVWSEKPELWTCSARNVPKPWPKSGKTEHELGSTLLIWDNWYI